MLLSSKGLMTSVFSVKAQYVKIYTQPYVYKVVDNDPTFADSARNPGTAQ